jgi:hypothetical protein
MTTVPELAFQYTEAGLSVIPIRADGSKAAAIPWETYQHEIAGPDELSRMFSNGHGLATIGGRVSGFLEILDFDDLPSYEAYCLLIIAQGAAELLERLVEVETPRPGRQFRYRCPDGVEGNQPLARRLIDGKPKALIETRAEGGYALVPGCPPACHPTGRTYELRRGDIFNPPIITAAERSLLLDTARSLNEYTEPARTHIPKPATDRNKNRPGDLFAACTTWPEILEPSGWKLVFERGGIGYWRRPGKRDGISATTNFADSDLLYVFSTSTLFEPEHTYSKFAAYAHMYHHGDYQTAARELARRGYGEPKQTERTQPREPGQPATAGFKLYDAGAIAEWPQEPLDWLAEGLIPKCGIGFMSAPPKDRKSLLTLDLALHLAQPGETRPWLGKFKVTPTKVLYIAREDPLRRVKDRALEICNSYRLPIPTPGRLQFLIRNRIHLTDIEHRAWLIRTIQANGFELLILDVINRMHPDLDEISSADMGKLVSILEELNRDLGITILADDHTRKPQGKNVGRDSQEPNPFDLKGSIAKYACADFMICLSRTHQANRMQVYCENKDSDERPHFFLDVSPKGSTEPKFQYAGNVTQLAGDMKTVGEANRGKVLESLETMGDWMSPKEISRRLSMSDSTVTKHITALLKAGKIDRQGKTRNIQYRAIFDRGKNMPQANRENLSYDND